MAPVLFRIAERGVRKNWRHSVGSTLAVAVAFAAIALFEGYLVDIERTLTAMMEEQFMLGTLLVERRGLSEAMANYNADAFPLRPPEQAFVDEYLAAHADEVAVRMRSLFISGMVSNGRASTPFGGWGYDPAEGAALRRRFAWDAWYGRPLQEATGDSVVVGRGLAALLDCAPATGDATHGPDGALLPRFRPFECRRPRLQLMGSSDSGRVNAVEAVVAGFADAGRKELDSQFLFLPLSLAQRLRNSPDISQYTVLLRDPSKVDRFVADLMAAARARGLAIDAIPWKQSYHGHQFVQGMAIFRVFRVMMAFVVVAIVGMAIFTTMAKAVTARTREVGTLRSLGFYRRHVVALFALEAALLSVVACALGLLVTLGVTALVNGAGIAYENGIVSNPLPLGIAVDPATYLWIAACLVGVAVLAAWLPARRAARLGIPDALAFA